MSLEKVKYTNEDIIENKTENTIGLRTIPAEMYVFVISSTAMTS